MQPSAAVRMWFFVALVACTPSREQLFGAKRWTLHLPTGGPIRSLAVAPSGPIVVSEHWSGETNAPTDTAILIDQFSTSDGELAWHREIDATSPNQVEMPHAATDPAGDLVLTGAYSGVVNFGGDLAMTSTGSGFVAKYDASGNVQWVRDGFGCGIAIAADSRGRAYAVDDRYTVNAFDVDGTLRWSRKLADDGAQSIAIVASSEDDIVVAVASFGNETVTWLSSDGDIRWSSPLARSQEVALAPDRDGQVVAANDSSVMLLDAQGYELWQTDSSRLYSVTVRGDRTIIAPTDAGLVAFSPDGEPLDQISLDPVQPIESPMIASEAHGAVVLAGRQVAIGPVLALLE